MKDFFSKYKLETIIFAAALFVRLIFFFFSFTHHDYELIPAIKGDDGYYELSQNILQGNGFSFDAEKPFQPNALRPPIWPFAIAGIAGLFGSYWAVFVFEVIIGSFIPVLGMHIARKIFAKKVIAVGTGILLSLEPYAIFLSTVFYTETMFTFLFLIFFVFLVRYFEEASTRNAVWMSVFLGLATLVKPTVQYVPIVLFFFMIFQGLKLPSRDALLRSGTALLVFGLIIAPWIVRNKVEFGRFGMSAQPAYNLYVYLLPSVLAVENKTSFDIEQRRVVKVEGFNEMNITLSTSDYYSGKALDEILNHKTALVKSVVATIITFFTHDGMLTFLQYAGKTVENTLSKPALVLLFENPGELLRAMGGYMKTGGIWILLVRLIWIAITVFLFVGAIAYLRKREWRLAVLFALFLVAYFALTTSLNGLGVNARFRVPVNTFIFSFALYGFLVVWMNIRSRFGRNHA